MAGEALFVPDPAGWAHAFHSEHGLLGGYMYDLGDTVANSIQRQAPGPGKPPVNRTGIYYGTGRTEASIDMKVIADGSSEIEAHIAAKPDYVKYIIHGTAPHIIRPKNPAGHLHFFWVRKGKSMTVRHVNHPGTIPNDFLTRGLILGWPL